MNLEILWKPVAIKVYHHLIGCALRNETTSAEQIIEATGLGISKDQVSEVLNVILKIIDEADIEAGRPRLTAIVIKRKQQLPIRKWFTRHFEIYSGLTSTEADEASYQLNLEQRRELWSSYVKTVYEYWDLKWC